MASIGTIRSVFHGIEKDFVKDCVLAACTAIATPIVATRIVDLPEDDPIVKFMVSAISLIIALTLSGTLVAYRQRRRRHKTMKASGNKIAVYITQLQGDDDAGNHRAILIDSLRDQIGSHMLEIIPEGELPVSSRDSSTDDTIAPRVEEKARDMLQKNGGSVYIWGRVFTIGTTTSLALRFVSLSPEHDGMDRQVFNITSENKLDAKLAPTVIKAVSMIVLSKIMPLLKGGNLDTQMKAIESFIRPLAFSPPAGVSVAETTQVRSIYAYYLYKRALKEKNIALLDDAEKAYRLPIEAEKKGESIDPIELAMAYFGLANVMSTRGEWKDGTTSIAQSLSHYKFAAGILTLKDHPLEWQAIHYAKGLAHWALGRMATGVEDLIEAAACFRVASGDITTGKTLSLPEQRQETVFNWQEAERNLGLVAVDIRNRGAHWDIHNMDDYMMQLSMRWHLRAGKIIADKMQTGGQPTLAETIDFAHAELWTSALWIGTEKEALMSHQLETTLRHTLKIFGNSRVEERREVMKQTLPMLQMLVRKAQYYPSERDIAREFSNKCLEAIDNAQSPLESVQVYMGLAKLQKSTIKQGDASGMIAAQTPYLMKALEYATRDKAYLYRADILEELAGLDYLAWDISDDIAHLRKGYERACEAAEVLTYDNTPSLYRSAHYWKASILRNLLQTMPESDPDYLTLTLNAAQTYEKSLTGVADKNDSTYSATYENIAILYGTVGEKVDDIDVLRKAATAYEESLAHTDKNADIAAWERRNFLYGQVNYIISEIEVRVDGICEPKTVLKMIKGFQAYLDSPGTDKQEGHVAFAQEWVGKAQGLLEGLGLSGDSSKWPERVKLTDRAA